MDSADANRAVVLADIPAGATLLDDLGEERAWQLLRPFVASLERLAGGHGGRALDSTGYEIVALFGHPEAAVRYAVNAQRQVTLLADQTDIRLRIGMAYGPVVEDGSRDVFGDAFNVAAELRSFASPGQVIATKTLIQAIDVRTPVETRALGQHSLGGRRQPLEVCEVIWEQDTELTRMPWGPQPDLDWPPKKLRLNYHGSTVELRGAASGLELTFGRGPENLLEVLGDAVSRRHATILVRDRKFYLRDHSTNGTFVRSAGKVLVVRRESVPLHVTGEISLGTPFEHAGADILKFEILEELTPR